MKEGIIFVSEASSTYCNLTESVTHKVSNRPLASIGNLGIQGHAETFRGM